MVLLDTSVLSALMSATPSRKVAAWFADQPLERLFTSAISQAEILSGLKAMPDGARRIGLERAAHVMFQDTLAGRALPFDAAAAIAHADLLTLRRRAGRPVATLDLMIAAIARSLGGSVATRNVDDFVGYGIQVIDPWSS